MTLTSSKTTKAPFNFMQTHESITVIYQGKTHVIKKGATQFKALEKAINEERWDDVPTHLTVRESVESWSNDEFKIDGSKVTYLGQELPDDINDRILSMAANGEDPTILFRFWERLSKNPSWRSVRQLYSFMKHANIPLTPEGKILTYKSVRHDYKDVHSNTFDNKPGTRNQMPRNQISDDPQVACHEGFHVGAMGYVRSFHSGGRIVVCEVDPEDVVCVPYDSSAQKMRVSNYFVIGNYGTELPSTSVSLEEIGRVPITDLSDGDEDDDEDDIEEEESEDEVVEESTPETEEAPVEEDAEEEIEDTVEPEKLELLRAVKTDVEEEASPPVKKKPKKGFSKFDKMGMSELIKQPLDSLRKYATYGLEIVGASKIPGGKTALITRILEVRE